MRLNGYSSHVFDEVFGQQRGMPGGPRADDAKPKRL